MVEEVWPGGSIYVNHWEAPTYMVSVEDRKLRGGGSELKAKIWDAAKSTIEEWTQMELRPTSMYGIRMYTENAVLNPHVDRLPLVSSCIINVDQDVDEPWPLEVYDRKGQAVNVTMEPGDMVLYESGSLIHGRPFPLKGRFYANIFIHFEPTGRPLGEPNADVPETFLPPYILPNSPEVDNWTRQNPHGWSKPSPAAPVQQIPGREGHTAAAAGDVDFLKKLAKTNKKALHRRDNNGWQPIHEAARGGYTEALQLLVEQGADVNSRTGLERDGSSPLNLALTYFERDHPVVQYLTSVGGEDIKQEL